jgi:hypothetical protein
MRLAFGLISKHVGPEDERLAVEHEYDDEDVGHVPLLFARPRGAKGFEGEQMEILTHTRWLGLDISNDNLDPVDV